ncbi:ribonuclease III domain-containing protein [Lophiotrema nucula]|uniref:Ribonuclease III domain-containing protein n=1 Tax=Lophiotrema nucula TaxID=690887 RepID=A0A6A5YKG0_9PLEO|nr:ribonuclease III domain-containing protein [Lophiotrema nucula]
MTSSYDMDQKVANAERILDYTFTKKELCLEALQFVGGPGGSCAPMIFGGITYSVPKYERLEAYGDKMLDYVLIELWVHTLLDKGRWDGIRQKTACNANLGQVGRKLGLNECALLQKGTEMIGDERVADLVEALIGAVKLDGGLEALEKVVRTLGLVPKELDPTDTTSSNMVGTDSMHSMRRGLDLISHT